MDSALVVDVIVVLTLVCAVLAGWARGLGRTVGGVVGAVLGVTVGASLVLPLVAEHVDARPQVPVAMGAVIACAVLGSLAGTGAGALLSRLLTRMRLGWADSVGGALAGAGVTVLAWALVAALVPATGSAVLTDSVSGSRAIAALTRSAPPALQDSESLARVLERTQPWLAEVAGSPTKAPTIPDVDLDTAAVRQATRSVVRVSGEAPGCRTAVTGSGFVVAPDRVMTNAHVVAGVDTPIVRAPGELPARGTVVYVDEEHDLALVATEGLDAPALRLDTDVRAGSEAVVAGYPGGGPLRLDPASVLSTRRTLVTVDGTGALRSVTTLGADIHRGNSGGPAIGSDGEVVGVIFAKAVGVDSVAYAVPTTVAAPVAERASSYYSAVATGSCEAA